jgi:Tol biopolymer transport system component
MKPSALILVLVTAVVSAAALAGSSQATSPGRDGRIAYMVKDGAGHWQVWVANSDLSGAKKLTHGRSAGGWAVWSPNGKRLAFQSEFQRGRANRTPKRSTNLFLMNPDGSDVKRLTRSKGVSGDAAWSPSGRLIAFDSDRGSRKRFSAIYVMNANGRKLRRITSPRHPFSDYKPRFSPDGTHLVFNRARGTAAFGPAALFTVRLDGRGLRQLTPYSLHADDSDWSPDGSQIVFEGYPNGPYGDIYVVPATGGRLVDLTPDSYGQADPVWSPDGRKILFLDNNYVNGVGRTGLATMNPNGSARQFIADKNLEAHQADWESIAGSNKPLVGAAARPKPRRYTDKRSEQQAVTFKVTGTARAAIPYKERDSVAPVTLTGACGFPVLLQPTAPDVLNILIFSDGELFSSGPEVSTATNLDSGKSVKINISGTFSLEPHNDGSATLTFTGPTLLEGGVINDGRSVFQFDANGNLTFSSVVGRRTNLCAELS